MPPKTRKTTEPAPDTYDLEETLFQSDRGVEVIVINGLDVETGIQRSISGRIQDRDLLLQDLQQRLREAVARDRDGRQLELLEDRSL